MTVKVQNTSTLSLTDGIKATVYGDSGTGKTRLLASAPMPIIISAEKGLLSVRKMNLDFIAISNLKELTEAYTWVTSSKEAAKYWTVCLDSITEIAEIILVDEMKKTTNGQRAYGQAQESIIALYRNFRDMPKKNVVFVAQMAMTADGVNGAKAFGPSLPGKLLPQKAPYFFDSVFQLNVGPADATGYIPRFLRTQPDLYNQAKDRSGNLDAWENADPLTGGGLTTIFEKMIK